MAFEREALREHPGQLTRELGRMWDLAGQPWVLVYHHAGLRVDGLVAPVPLRLEFYEQPMYDCYGQAPEDYPRVFADQAESKHRMPDGALCLWYPLHPPWMRWRHQDGLDSLLRITARHLFDEAWWRADGADECAEWLGAEVDHGFAWQRPERSRRQRAGRKRTRDGVRR